MRQLLTRLRSTLRLLTGWRTSAREDREAREEMRFHLEMQTEKLRRSGMTPAEANRQAHLAFGGVTTWAEVARDEYRWRPLEEIAGDLRYAARALARVPSFTIAVVLSLAIGIGATTTAYTVTDRVLLRSLPYPDAGRIVALFTNFRERPMEQGGNSFPDYSDWITSNPDIEAAAAIGGWAPLLDGDTPQVVGGISVTADYFRVLGSQPILGRTFSADESSNPDARVVLVSYDFWQRHLGGRADAVGSELKLSGRVHRVIGVLPKDLRDSQRLYGQPTSLWRPLVLPPSAMQRGVHFMRTLVRLRPGVTVETAQQHLNGIASRLSREYPQTNGNRGVLALALQEQMVGPSRPLILAAFGASLCVLLIACANVATLVHARQAVRRGELALRKAMGAEAGRLVRLLITESTLLCLAGALGGLVIAVAGTALLRHFAPIDLPRVDEIVPDTRVLAVVAGIALATVLAFGLRPAFLGARTDALLLLQDVSARSTRRTRSRAIVVSLEIALTLVLLALTGLLTRSLMRLNAAPLGFDAPRLLSFRILAPGGILAGQAAQQSFTDRLAVDLQGEAGVVRIAAVSEALLNSAGNSRLFAGAPSHPHNPGVDTRVNSVSPGYFATAGIHIIAGREFTVGDSAHSERVAVINRAAAEVMFPSENAVGQLFLHFIGDTMPSRIVGVVDDARIDGPIAPVKPELYEPRQQSNWGEALIYVVRTTRDPSAILPAVRRSVKAIAPTAAIVDATSLDELAAQFSARQRFYSAVFAIFAVIGLVLASIGIYGLVAYTVVLRRREVAIRSALGASVSTVVGQFLRDGLVTVGAGVVAGIAATIVSSRIVTSLLFGISPTDPLAIGGGAALLLLIGLVATFVPALTATSAPIVDVLRSE